MLLLYNNTLFTLLTILFIGVSFMDNTLLSLREHIKHLDSQLYTLLNERSAFVRDIGYSKIIRQQHIFAPLQEQYIYQQCEKTATPYLSTIKEIVATARNIQGLSCYVLHDNDFLFAKLALGIATNVIKKNPLLIPKEQRFLALYFIPQKLEIPPLHYIHASYSLITPHDTFLYYVITLVPSDTIVSFTVSL